MNQLFNRYYLLARRKFFSMSEPYLENRILEDVTALYRWNAKLLQVLFIVTILALFIGLWSGSFLIIGIVTGISMIGVGSSIFSDLTNNLSNARIYQSIPIDKIKFHRTSLFLLLFIPNILTILSVLFIACPIIIVYGVKIFYVYYIIFYCSAYLFLRNIIYLLFGVENFSHLFLLWLFFNWFMLFFPGRNVTFELNKHLIILLIFYLFLFYSFYLVYQIQPLNIKFFKRIKQLQKVRLKPQKHSINLVDRFLANPLYSFVLISIAAIYHPLCFLLIIFFFGYMGKTHRASIRFYAMLPLSKKTIFFRLTGLCFYICFPSLLYRWIHGIFLDGIQSFTIFELGFYLVPTFFIIGMLTIFFISKDVSISLLEFVNLLILSTVSIALIMHPVPSLLNFWLGILLMTGLFIRFAILIWNAIYTSSEIYKVNDG